MSIDSAFGYQSQETRALAAIDSTKYPDTNKDFEQNIIRLNQFVDYLAAYIGVMQKGIDKNNQDALGQLQGTISDVIVLLGGGELLYGIDLGDLQYFLPAIGALLGFDTTTPFPINLFNAAEHFFLGYVVPLDSFSVAVEGIIDGWAEALGINAEWIQSINDVLDAISNLTMSFEDLLTAVEDMISIMGPFDQVFADIWHSVTVLLGGSDLASLGNLADPVFAATAPWIEELAVGINELAKIIEAFAGGVHNVQAIINFSTLFTPFLDLLSGPTLPDGSWDFTSGWQTLIQQAIMPQNLVAGLIPDASGSLGLTGYIPMENLALDLISGVVGGSQELVDAILGSVGYAPGSGTVTEVNQYFIDFMSMLANPGLSLAGFDPNSAVATFISDMIHPQRMLAPLVSDLIPANFIPGLDATQIISGQFPQSMVSNLTSDLNDRLLNNVFVNKVLGQTNQIIGPNFEDSTIIRETMTGATHNGYSTTQSHGGNQSYKIVAALGNNEGLWLLPSEYTGATARDPKSAFWVQPGHTFLLQVWISPDSFNDPGGDMHLGFVFRDSKGITPELFTSDVNATAPVTPGFVEMICYQTVPPGYDLMWPVVYVDSLVPVGNIFYIDDVLLREQTLGMQIIDQLYNSTNILDTILAINIPGLDATNIISGQFPQSMVSGLPTDLAAKLGINDPLNAQNLFNQVPTQVLGMIPYSHVGGGNPNLVSMPGFDNSGSITGNPNWSWLNTDGHTSLGCAQTVANGTLLTLVSNIINVSQGQQLSFSSWIKYTSLVATAGQNALRMNVAAYLGSTSVTTQQVAGIASPSGTTGWTQITGTWTVPAGVDNIVLQLVVTQAATAGTVLFDDISAIKTGLMSGDWMSGISGTVAQDIQSVADQIYQALMGGSSTGNALSTIKNSLLNIPGNNIISLLAATVIPNLDASKVVSGILGVAQIPNILLSKSTDMQSLNDYITNTLVGVIGQYTATTLLQSNSSMTSLYDNLNANTTNIQNLRSAQTANTVSGGGVNINVNFSSYPDGPLPNIFTNTYVGAGSSALGIKGGNAGWSPLNNDGNRTCMCVYNVAPTNTDYQIVRGSMAAAPAGATSGGQPRIGGMARVDNPANPQNYCWARAYCTGFLSYKADFGYTVAGVDTIIQSGVSLTWSMDINVIVGANGNPRRYQAYSGTQLVYDQVEPGSASMIGAGYRYWGCKTEMKTGSSKAGDPGLIASTAVSDNAPPTVLGSTARFTRKSTTNVSYVHSGLTTPVTLPANFFDTQDYMSPDMTWDGTNVTIKTEGTYLINIRYKAVNIPNNSKIDGVLFVNGSVARQLGANFADSYLANSGDAVIGSTQYYTHVGDVLTPGYASNGVGTLNGENTGTCSYWEIALLNRSMY